MKLVVLDVEVDNINNELPPQKLEQGEHIVRKIVELDKLNDVLKGRDGPLNVFVIENDGYYLTATHVYSLDYGSRGFVIDARLSHFATGWDFSRKLSKE